ncbi:glutaminyl-peptide cyclotransferase [Kineobactrum sediminis]|uniref:glutaminyl-peptide cyclotransferase n=1 Tax=Kineobactrum sediminis TaxID=1905677 RepID=UPI00139026D1|nr:glutaminyl-peptide cyclotransferase [Kineobactrum sediminis]
MNHFSYRGLLVCLLLGASLRAPAETAAQAHPLQHYSFKVVEQRPQSRTHFVQGLQIVDGMLYVSTGGYGRSQLLQYRFDDGVLVREKHLSPALFGEGLTVLGGRVYQLTWRARRLLVYRRQNLAAEGYFAIPGQGWGLTNNGKELIYTDGSHHLHFLDPVDGRHLRSIAVHEQGAPVDRLNELEWIDGEVWANVWQSDRIVVINPDTGAVTATIDLTGLLPRAERRQGTDVLNGIARNPATGELWVTGKNWPWLYRIVLTPIPAATAKSR